MRDISYSAARQLRVSAARDLQRLELLRQRLRARPFVRRRQRPFASSSSPEATPGQASASASSGSDSDADSYAETDREYEYEYDDSWDYFGRDIEEDIEDL